MKVAKLYEDGSIQYVMDADVFPGSSQGFVEVPEGTKPETHWFDNGVLTRYKTENYKTIPLNPSKWCPKTEQWQDARSIDELTSAKLKEIEDERNSRLNAPIEFSNVLVDADSNSQLNMATKLKELEVAEELGAVLAVEDLFWRDFNNNNKVFDSVKEMKTWLQGLIGAISARSSAIYSWSWQMKQKAREAKNTAELSAVTW